MQGRCVKDQIFDLVRYSLVIYFLVSDFSHLLLIERSDIYTLDSFLMF